MLTYNDIPEAVGQLLDQVAILSAQVQVLTNKIDNIKQTSGNEKKEKVLVCGIFEPGEFVAMSDRRLWEGEQAPFRSRYAVAESRKHGARWKASSSGKSYRIRADQLEAYLMGK